MQPEPARPLLHTLRQAAAQLAIGLTTMRGLIRDGEISATWVGGCIKIADDDLREFIARNRVRGGRREG
jgi:excisionase family DNA binding protein